MQRYGNWGLEDQSLWQRHNSFSLLSWNRSYFYKTKIDAEK